MGKCNGGLYRMDSVAGEKRALMVASDVEVWHKMLGHASVSELTQVNFFRKFCEYVK